jgi:hypothetical protein
MATCSRACFAASQWLVAAALSIGSALAQVPTSHAVGSPWSEQAEKKANDCSAAYHGPLSGDTPVAARAAERQFDRFLHECDPQIDEYFAANKAYNDETLARSVFVTSASPMALR